MSAILRLRHLFDRWSVWVLAALLTGNTITVAIEPDLDGPLDWVMWPVVILHGLGLVFLGRKHEPITCAPCWDRFPVNPADRAANRARPFLAYVHVVLWVSDRLRGLTRLHLDAWSAGVIASMLLLVSVVSLARLVIPPPWISLIMVGYVVFFVQAMQRHAQLQPWCRWCDHGGGDDEQPQTPDPQPSTGRDLKPVAAV